MDGVQKEGDLLPLRGGKWRSSLQEGGLFGAMMKGPCVFSDCNVLGMIDLQRPGVGAAAFKEAEGILER